MADEDGAKLDRSAMTEPSKQPAPPARPASTNNEAASTSTPLRARSKSPQQNLPPQSGSLAKTSLPESQPMTTSSSSSSMPPDQQTDTAGASPYGTRSRNRAGISRPNYAEDRDIDTEYEWISSRKSQGVSGSASSNNVLAGESDKASGANTRRSSTTASNGLVAGNKNSILHSQNNNIPGMSSFSVYPDPSVIPGTSGPGRKRKAPGTGPGFTAHHIPSVVTQTSTPGTFRRNGFPPSASRSRLTNLMTFDDCQGYLKDGKLKADDGTIVAANDQVYLVCEPPGEPYYLARIMEFLHVDNDPSAPVDSLRVNWFLRSRDIGRKVNDTRVVFASMQSDTSPITSLRGKCRILHRTEIMDLDSYRKDPNSFWYEKLFDRYIHRCYEVIPTSQVINVPAKVKRVLDERWKFVVLEVGRGRELTSAIKSCKRCQGYCASNDSVDCAVCKNTYHMECVKPPLLKKPARGFGWSCGPCSRKQERKLEARNTPIVGEKVIEGEEEEFVDEEDDEHGAASGNGSGSNVMDTLNPGARPPTVEQIAQAKLWPFRYLGIHCRVEDALDYDDRIYPRASSRLGPKHQATVQAWYGRRVELVKPADVKRRYFKGNGHKKDTKPIKDSSTTIDTDKTAHGKRPKWVMDEPPGYVARGEDYPNNDPRNTARLNFRLPQVGEASSRGGEPSHTLPPDRGEAIIDEYMAKAKTIAPSLGLQDYSTNFLDKALELLVANNYHIDKALQQLRHVNKRKDLKEPDFSKEEIRRFEDGVKKYGSELRLVSKQVGKTQKHGEVVRFYYMWKKTSEGKRIWGNFEGRKGKKQQKQTDSKLVDDVADDIDDSAFDNGKAAARKRGFECKFCTVRFSPQWRRAPNTAPGATVPIDPSLKNSKDKHAHLMLALCQRCAYLWRCYAIAWENPDEVAKKLASAGGRALKRRVDEELLAELTTANVASSLGVSTTAAAAAASIGIEVPSSLTIQPGQDAPKKKQKLIGETPTMPTPQTVAPIEPPKKKAVEKVPEPPLIPEQPRMRILPCAVCYEFVAGEEATNEYLCCVRCRLTVHRHCYGVAEGRPKDKWTCDMCINDTAHQVSINYDCILCPVRENTDTELMEAPKSHHKKKNDREKEKERLERELLINATENYYRGQREKGRPEQPRQPLKRTTNNNWVHVICAIFHSEIRFADPKRLEPAEGFGAIGLPRYYLKCKLCKKAEGACVNCSQCQANIHPACAQQHGYQLGFDITPIKGSRANAVNIVDMNGDKGTAAAVIYCKEHVRSTFFIDEKTGIHHLAELLSDPDNLDVNINALQAYARTHKQADTSMTGTLRKALLLDSATSTATQISTNHRGSISSSAGASFSNSIITATTRASRASPGTTIVKSDEMDQNGDRVMHLNQVNPVEPDSKHCVNCDTTVSPKWHLNTPKTTTEIKMDTVTLNGVVEDTISRSGLTLCNSDTVGDSSKGQIGSATPMKSTQPEMEPVVNGRFGEDGAADTGKSADAIAQSSVPFPLGNSEAVLHWSTVDTADNLLPGYLCNKCFQRKRNEPTPRHTPSPEPEPEPEPELEPELVPESRAELELELEPALESNPESEPKPQLLVETNPIIPIDPVDICEAKSEPPESHEVKSSPSSAPLVWPSQVAQASPQDRYHTWPSQQSQSVQPVQAATTVPPTPSVPPLHSYHGLERPPTGITHSPPIAAPPPPQHYPPPPPPTHHPANYAPPQNYRDSRGVLHRGLPPQYHVPHLVNGLPAEPPSFQYRRDSSGHLYQIPYVPPAMRQQPASTIRSPPRHDHSSQGPHGPPEAAENPFAVPRASRSPPRQTFGGIYGSPAAGQERPDTPPDNYARDGRWPGEGSLAKGASASPSLRNLLH